MAICMRCMMMRAGRGREGPTHHVSSACDGSIFLALSLF